MSSEMCAQCGRALFGIAFSVKIDGEKFLVCSFECEKALKEKHKGESNDGES